MLAEEVVQSLAGKLDEALLARRELKALTQTEGAFELDDAYRIQQAGLALRLGRGERIVGWKMGLTSRAKREQMNLASPIYGALFGSTRVEDGGAIEVASGIHPKIEPEIAFVTRHELRGPISFVEAEDAIGEVRAALEVLDSRFLGFRYFSLPDVVADNCSSWRFLLGEPRAPGGLQLGALPMRLSIDGAVKQEALSSAISGHPIESLVQLCAMLYGHGRALPAGSIVLAGAATVAELLVPGQQIELSVEGLPSVHARAT